MTSDKARRLSKLTNQLTELVMTVAICAREIRSLIQDELSSLQDAPQHGNGHAAPIEARPRPHLESSTLCVEWHGQSLHLGNTVCFRLLDRLARRPNQYVTHLDLIRDVWDEEDTALATVRSMMRHLRRKLREGGMEDLAVALQGHNGRYILVL